MTAKYCDLPALGLMARVEFLIHERGKHIPDGPDSEQGLELGSLQTMLSNESLSPWYVSPWVSANSCF